MSDIVERLRGAAAKPNGWAILGADAATEAAAEIESLRSRLAEARCVCDEQATDAGLWFVAEMVTEAYLQAALRRLHAAVEGTADSADAPREG